MADYTGVVYQEISLDVSEPNQFAPILVAQGDAYTRGLKITMTQHGEKLNIPNTGVTAALNACNMADNTKKASVMAEISSDGTITAIIPSVVMEAAGYVQCDVSVIGSDGSNTTILKSTVFYLNCEASADTDGSSQPPEDDVITAAIASIAGKVDSSVYNQKIGEIEQDINGLESDIDSIDLQLGTIEQSLGDKADKSSTYTKDNVDEALSDKANYVRDVGVNNCVNLGAIYKTNVYFGEDILQAMVISSNDTVEGKLAQFAFTENGKILYRTKIGSSWSGSDLFKELGSE